MKQIAVTSKLPTYVRGKINSAIVPVKYAEAVKALQECRSIDEAKLWGDKADALAAWARIYSHDEAGKQAKLLKLHAFRRMGELAEALRPTRPPQGCGNKPGAHSLLVEHGVSRGNATMAMRLSRAPEAEFRAAVEQGDSFTAIVHRFRGTGIRTRAVSSDAWCWLVSSVNEGMRLSSLVSGARSRPARQVAAALRRDEALKARKLVLEIIEWLDEFERCLPKQK